MKSRDLMTASEVFDWLGVTPTVGWWCLAERLIPRPLFTDPEPLWSRSYLENYRYDRALARRSRECYPYS